MADAPKVRIEPAAGDGRGGTTRQEPDERPYDGEAFAAPGDDIAGEEETPAASFTTTSRVGTWLTSRFPGNEHAVLGALCGLVIALLVFGIGLWRTLLMVVLVGGGAIVGKALDGDVRIITFVRKLLSERHG